MAGHKYIDSTKRYALEQTDTLTGLLAKHQRSDKQNWRSQIVTPNF